MNGTTVVINLAKSAFQRTVTDASCKVLETHRL
jgi:hypothetical protein